MVFHVSTHPSARRQPDAFPSADAPMLDEIDRLIVASLQVAPRASWQRIATTLEVSESTVARRAKRLLKSGVVRVAALPDSLQRGVGFSVFMRIECQVGTAGDVGCVLATRPDVRLVTMTAGSYDLLAEIVVPSRAYLARFVLQDLNQIPGIQRTTSETVIRNFKTAYDWARPLLGQGAARLSASISTPEVPVTHTADTSGVDVDDLHLIQLLTGDGRLSASELAQESRLSESAVRRRLDALIARRAIDFGAFVDPARMGYHAPVFLWLDVDIRSLETVVLGLMTRPEVRYLSATAGHSELTAEVILPDLNTLYQFLTEVVKSLPGINRAEVDIELLTLKRGYRNDPRDRP